MDRQAFGTLVESAHMYTTEMSGIVAAIMSHGLLASHI